MRLVLGCPQADVRATWQGRGFEVIDTGGLVVPINGFETGVSPSTQSFILRPADVPGGATVVQEAFEGEFAQGLA